MSKPRCGRRSPSPHPRSLARPRPQIFEAQPGIVEAQTAPEPLQGALINAPTARGEDKANCFDFAWHPYRGHPVTCPRAVEGGGGRRRKAKDVFVTMEPGFVTLEPGFVTLEPGFVTLEPGFVTLEPGFVTLGPGFVTLEPGFVTLEPGLGNLNKPYT